MSLRYPGVRTEEQYVKIIIEIKKHAEQSQHSEKIS